MFRRRAPPASARLVCASQGDYLVLILEGPDGAKPLAEWARAVSAHSTAVGKVLAIADAGRADGEGRPLVQVEERRLVLGPSLVAEFDAVTARALGLPGPTPLGLDLRPSGRVDEDRFHIEVRWVRPGGQRVRAEVQGALIQAEGERRRIPEPLWSLHRAASALASPVERTDRFRALAALREAWPEDPLAPVEADPFLKDLRVHYASAMSVRLKALAPGQTDFEPVLFGARTLAEAEDDNRGLDEDHDSVLPAAAQRLFAEDRFLREAEARAVYSLRHGEYVFIDPALRPMLGVVRRLQDRPEAERRAFILNPRATLRDALTAAGVKDPDIEDLFIETEQFSERVAGVDVWRAPVLPWIMPSHENRWLPEQFGLFADGVDYPVKPENVEPLIEETEGAVSRGEPTIPFEGLLEPSKPDGVKPPGDLPNIARTVDGIGGLQPSAPGYGVGEEASPAFDFENRDAAQRLFLVVRENFDEVEFDPLVEDNVAAPQAAAGIVASRRVVTSLKPHQIEGLRWLVGCAMANRRGALLADDMGLGKTLQAIAFMAWLQDEASAGRRRKAPFLIVAPTGLLGNWKAEIERHLDREGLGPLLPVFGGNLKRLRETDSLSARDIETGRASLNTEAWRDARVLLTTYETLRDYHFSFARSRFGLAVFDEIQKLKNPASQVTRSAKTLNAEFILGMTGTPVENRLQDLWSIMDVIMPGLLGSSRDFERSHRTTDREALSRLKTRLMDAPEGRPPYMMRRLKSDALRGMPAKTIHALQVEMPPTQATAYRDLVMRATAAAASGTLGRGGMLSYLSTMRGISLHPLDPSQAPPDLEIYARDSARLSRTLEVLKEIAAKGEKALIFVEDLAMQDRLAGLIQSRFGLPVLPARINGGVPGPRRQALVDGFQNGGSGFDVMILSPKAGGVGLTLTAANHVIHLSRWWNPAVEDQATDRVFRIGQNKDVHVHLPLAVHPDPVIGESSFDLRLNTLIESKRQLTRDLFLPPDADDADLRDLFEAVSGGKAATAEFDAVANVEPGVEVQPSATQPSIDSAAPLIQPTEPLSGTPAPARLNPSRQAQTGIPRNWRVAAGQPRPTEALFALFEGQDVERITIRDPYAIASATARHAQVEFIAGVASKSRRLGAVVVEYAPDVDSHESESIQRSQFGALLLRRLQASPPRWALSPRPRRGRGRDDDFHDRTIELLVKEDGNRLARHEIWIGRGATALFDTTRQCTVSYVPPGD